MIFFYGNCQIQYLINCLSLLDEFRKKYNIPKVPIQNKRLNNIVNKDFIYIVNFLSIKNKDSINEYFNNKYDLAIIQHTDIKHNEYSTEYIKDKLNCDKVIILPFIVNNGYFALSREGNLGKQLLIKENKIFESENGLMGSQQIIDLFTKYPLNEIINMLKKLEIDFNTKERFNISLQILKEKEKYCNLIVSDIIEKELSSKYRLFYQNVHITGYFYQLICNKIYNYLNFETNLEIYNTSFENMNKLDISNYIKPPFNHLVFSPYEIRDLGLNQTEDNNWIQYYIDKIIELHNGYIEIKRKNNII